MPQSRRTRLLLWDLLGWAGLCGLGFLVIYRFAAGTSPIQPDHYVWDSALFQVVGKLWADGLTPYVDIFDHKGPLLFLMQKIAYHFSHPRMALYVLESLMMSLSLGLCYQTLRLKMKPWTAFSGAVVMLVFWLPVMEYGNLCETHSMPWLMLALYLQLRYMACEKAAHPPLYALVYGLCFGANLMIRPNNGVLIAVVTFVITVDLAARGKWRNILQNALALIAGVLAAVVPFVLYFHRQGALSEFIYATWTFNLLYAKSLEFALDWQGIRNVLFFITPSMLCLFLGAICCLRRQWRMAGVLILSAAATLLLTLSGVGYAHYFMLHVPLIPLALFVAHALCRQGGGWRWVVVAACAGFALLCVRTTLPYARQNVLQQPTAQTAVQEESYDAMVYAIEAQIPPSERNAVAVCGLTVEDAELFLKTQLHPVGRYCFLVDWHARADHSVRMHLENTLKSGEARWLICRSENADDALKTLIDDCFRLHSEYSHGSTLYQLYQWQ